METYQIIITIIGYLFGAGGLVFWFLERRKFNAEVAATLESVQASKIDNDVKLSEHYREILDDLKRRYEDRFREYEMMMNNKIKILKDEITLLRKQVKTLKDEIREKDKRIKELSTK